ncbi:MAG: hypothetical protein AMJ43_07815 [Coxiella sp. DG_40]|nr:MAG: hypothetical protein AMJ43_07815 [Coxiella sp. DG_40]
MKKSISVTESEDLKSIYHCGYVYDVAISLAKLLIKTKAATPYIKKPLNRREKDLLDEFA